MNSKSYASGVGGFNAFESPQRMKPSQSGQYETAHQQKLRSPLQYAGGMIASNALPISNASGNSKHPRQSKQTNSLPLFRDQQLLILERNNHHSLVEERVKQLMPILTLKRLRKMQALVRGFLCRRITYPPLLRQHRLCQAVYHSVRRRVTDKLITEVVLEVITFNKYNDNLSLHSPDSTAVVAVADSIVERVVAAISRDVVTASVADMSRSLLPVRNAAFTSVEFVLGDPVELLAYEMFLREISLVKRPIAQEAIAELVDDIRLEGQIKEFLLDGLLQSLYQEVVSETLEEYAAHDIAKDLIEAQVGQATESVVEYEYEKAIRPLQKQAMKDLDRNFLIMLVGEALLQTIADQQPQQFPAEQTQPLPEPPS